MEKWTKAFGFENYEVSNLGRVRSVERKETNSLGYTRTLKSKIMSLKKAKTGYMEITLRDNCKPKTILLHRLVMMSFCQIENYSELKVNHIDGDKENNKLENLEWCTQYENHRHSQYIGLTDPCKLEDDQVISIYLSNKKQHELAKEYGVNQSMISQIKNKVCHKQLTDRYDEQSTN